MREWSDKMMERLQDVIPFKKRKARKQFFLPVIRASSSVWGMMDVINFPFIAEPEIPLPLSLRERLPLTLNSGMDQ